MRTLDLAGNVLPSSTLPIDGMVNPNGYVAGQAGQSLVLDGQNSEAVLIGA